MFDFQKNKKGNKGSLKIQKIARHWCLLQGSHPFVACSSCFALIYQV